MSRARSKPKLLIVAPNLGIGGLEKVIETLAERLPVDAGISVEVVCRSISDVARGSPLAARSRALSPDSRWRFLCRLIGEVSRQHPKFVMSTANDLALFAWIACQSVRPRPALIISQHLAIQASIESAGSLIERVKRRVTAKMLRFAASRADACIAVSKSLGRELMAMGAPSERTHVIENPIIDASFPSRIATAAAWPWPDKQKPTIVFCGRLAPEKRLDLLLAAFLVCRKSVNVRLLILGDGPLMPWLVEQINQKRLQGDIACLGFVNDPLPLLAQSSVLALTSDVEGFGNVLVEALAAGIPVVSTDCPSGPSDVLEGGRFGILTPMGDEEALGKALIRAVAGNAPSDAVGRREHAQKFSVTRAIDLYAAVLRGVHRDSGPAGG